MLNLLNALMTLFVLGIGLPASGKTTLLRPIASVIGASYVASDDVRRQICGDATDHSQEEAVWRHVKERIRALAPSGPLVLDATNCYLHDRREAIATAREAGASRITGAWFRTPIEICLERNAGRSRLVPVEVIRAMHGALVEHPPGVSDGLDTVVEFSLADR